MVLKTRLAQTFCANIEPHLLLDLIFWTSGEDTPELMAGREALRVKVYRLTAR